MGVPRETGFEFRQNTAAHWDARIFRVEEEEEVILEMCMKDVACSE